ncbi:MAG TPA: DUF1569 domain-containing protein [Sphingobacteriaceae bacterium]
MKSVFNQNDVNELLSRLDQLSPASERQWGKMTVGQMLAHCNVTYELVYENKHPKPNAFVKFLLKLFVKNFVVNAKPYKPNGQTAPVFLVKDDKDFATEKIRLVNYINKTREMGGAWFNNRESHSFGKLTRDEWNNMFYKHLDHHLKQFGV